MSAGLPSVKNDRDVVPLQLSVFNKSLNKRFPLLLKVSVLNAYEVVTVYDDRGNMQTSRKNVVLL
jgi:hypothetical protein